MSKVLGIDPGLATTGYGVIESRDNKLHPLDYGTIRTRPESPLPTRLKEIHGQIKQLINKHKVNVGVIEDAFFAKDNMKSVFLVGQVRGVAILACVERGLEIRSFTPLQVKQAIVGYGRASKNQVQEMVKILLSLKEIPEPADAADALAIALCHLQSGRISALEAAL